MNVCTVRVNTHWILNLQRIKDLLNWLNEFKYKLVVKISLCGPSIRPFSVAAYPILGRRGLLEPLPAAKGPTRGPPWAGSRLIVGGRGLRS